MKRLLPGWLLWVCCLWLGLPAAASVAWAGKDTGVAAGGGAPAKPAPVVLVMGDSLSAAFGIPLQQGWVRLLAQRLQKDGSPVQVVNASISGETTQGGVTRLPAELARVRPAVVVIELGANDGLRGQSLDAMRDNLRQMIRLSKAAGAKVLVLGMRIPPNYGPQYGEGFYYAFDAVAGEAKVPVVRFFLERVALRPELVQADGLHPTAEAQPLLLETVWPALKPLLPK
ncbi:MAG: arylesterase [Burkholderiales bacterium]